MFWTVSGWVIALLSLIVNVLMFLKNQKLNTQITTFGQTVGNNSNVVRQTHTGTGDNIAVKGKADIKK